MALLTKKITASTLLESLIAMVVVMVSFAIASAIYLQILSSGGEFQKLKAAALLQKIADETKQNRLYLDDNITVDQFVVEKKVVSYNGQKHLFHLKLKVFMQKEKQLAEYNELITIQ
jgi:Tfp pilus assembly protein PilV